VLLFIKQFTIAVDMISAGLGIAAKDNAMSSSIHSLFNLTAIIMLLFINQIAFREKVLLEKRSNIFRSTWTHRP
jgi:phosphate:Na+ symporter